MKPFTYQEPASLAETLRLLSVSGARLIAGGSDLLGELKDGLATYGSLISLRRVPGLDDIAEENGGLRLGALVTLSQLEHEQRLTGPYRILSEAARGVANPEIRNQGTLGGNLCQRPRCLHYRSPWIACAKKGGTDCPASESPHQGYLSVFGGSGCVAVNASDLAPVLVALRAKARIASPAGERVVPLHDFFTGPETDVRRENVLDHADVLIAVHIPSLPRDWKGAFLKSRERTAGDFPVVSIAFGCRKEAGKLRDARLVLGGVAPVPRRCSQAEAVLEGQAISPAAIRAAADAAFADAAPLPSNAYKVELGRALVARAVEQITGMR